MSEGPSTGGSKTPCTHHDPQLDPVLLLRETDEFPTAHDHSVQHRWTSEGKLLELTYPPVVHPDRVERDYERFPGFVYVPIPLGRALPRDDWDGPFTS